MDVCLRVWEGGVSVALEAGSKGVAGERWVPSTARRWSLKEPRECVLGRRVSASAALRFLWRGLAGSSLHSRGRSSSSSSSSIASSVGRSLSVQPR